MRRDIEDRLIGEYIVSHLSVGPNCGYGEHAENRHEVQFDPPEDHNPIKLVVFRPAELDGTEPYREIEIQRWDDIMFFVCIFLYFFYY